MVWSLTLHLSLTSGLYPWLQFHPQLLRKICLGSHSGLAFWYSSVANQSQQGINSSVNLALTKRSALGSWPYQASTGPSHSAGAQRSTASAATPVIKTQILPEEHFILKKQTYQDWIMWTNGSERWPKSDGMLRSYLVFQHVISGADQAVPSSGPKATLADCLQTVYPCVSVGIPQRFNSSAVLSCPARSVFVGRVAAAGSGGDGRESCAPRRRGVWCGLQRGPHAQVSVWVLFLLFFSVHLMISMAPAHAQRHWIYFVLCIWNGWATVFHGWVERRLCMREGGLLSAWFIQGLTLLLSQCDLLGRTVILFSRCSASPRAAGLSLRAVQLCIFICSLYLALPPLALAHTWESASKSALGSADEPEQQSLSGPQAVVYLSERHEWKFVNAAACQLTACRPTDWINLHNYIVWPKEISFFKHIMGFWNYSCLPKGKACLLKESLDVLGKCLFSFLQRVRWEKSMALSSSWWA